MQSEKRVIALGFFDGVHLGHQAFGDGHAQPGALNAQQFDQIIDAVKGLDMAEVHKQVAEAEAAQAEQA